MAGFIPTDEDLERMARAREDEDRERNRRAVASIVALALEAVEAKLAPERAEREQSLRALAKRVAAIERRVELLTQIVHLHSPTTLLPKFAPAESEVRTFPWAVEFCVRCGTKRPPTDLANPFPAWQHPCRKDRPKP